MKKRLTALFIGMVQGVGFRFTVERIARQFEVTGYVRNLPNGHVELVAEGEETDAKDFLKAVCESSLSHYIHQVQTKWSEAQNNLERFRISF